MKRNTVILLSKAKQSKAKQSRNCILNNNFKFYISQIFKTFNFLSADFRFCRLLASLQKLFSNIIKLLFIFELPIFKQNFNFAKNIYLNVFNKKFILSRRIFL